MASRLYSTTRPLYTQVARCLRQLGLASLGSPTVVALIGLYVTGLILLDVRQTQTRVARFLPGRCHDALNRLLRTMPLSTRALMGLLIRWVHQHGDAAYLCLDDVVVEKAFAKKLPWAAWTYSFAPKRKVYGLHIVVLLWCGHEGTFRIPVAFRLWRPKRSCSKAAYRTKLQLAEAMLRDLLAARLAFDYLVFDTHYTAGWFTRRLGRFGVTWVGTLPPRTVVVYRGKRSPVSTLAETLPLKWRSHLGLRATALQVYAPSYGTLRLVVTRSRHGNFEYLVSNDLAADLTTMVRRKRARWSIAPIFHDSKQYAGLGACQCRADQAMVRHVALVLLTFVILQLLRRDVTEPVAAVKERWQLALLRQGEAQPPPLRACPPHLRATAQLLSLMPSFTFTPLLSRCSCGCPVA
ncbi:MAG: transposase [Chloroflexi bacterium]|nr:transposase [Chloroflexota bacterium]